MVAEDNVGTSSKQSRFLSQHHHGLAVELWKSDCECGMVVTCLYFHPGYPDWIPSSVPCLAMYVVSNCLTSPCLNFLSLQNRADNHSVTPWSCAEEKLRTCQIHCSFPNVPGQRGRVCSGIVENLKDSRCGQAHRA